MVTFGRSQCVEICSPIFLGFRNLIVLLLLVRDSSLPNDKVYSRSTNFEMQGVLQHILSAPIDELG